MRAGRGEKQGGGGGGGGGGREELGPSSAQGGVAGRLRVPGRGGGDGGGGGGGGGLYGEDGHTLKLFGDESLVDRVIFMEKVQPAAVLVGQEALHNFPVDAGIVG